MPQGPPDTLLPQPTLFPPNGIDRADGTSTAYGVLPGTPDPPAAIMMIGNDSSGNPFAVNKAGLANFFEEYPDSPTIERSEQATITHRFVCDESTGIDMITTFGRGTILTDSFLNSTKVLTTTLTHNRGGFYTFTMVSEGLTFDNPPDLFSIEIVELNPAAEKHPRYSDLSYQDRYTVRNANITDASDLSTQYESVISTFTGGPSGSNPGAAQFPGPPVPRNQYNEAKELLLKLHKGEDSFYLPGYKISWSQYFWSPQPLNAGGFIEDPIGSGTLPFYFWSLNGSEDPGSQTQPGIFSNSWFADLAAANPTIFGTGISWLRLADSVDYERTWYKITHTWQGGPLGQWDQQWYIVNPQQAYQTSDVAGANVLTGA